jgi:hypothetical protein
MPKPRGRRPPAPKQFRLMVDDQSRCEVTCITDASQFMRTAFRTGARSITVIKLRSAPREGATA